jgi:hypothetical protein
VPDWTRTAISTATVALQEFPNQRVRGVLEGKPALFEIVWFEVYSDYDFSPPSKSSSICAITSSFRLVFAWA